MAPNLVRQMFRNPFRIPVTIPAIQTSLIYLPALLSLFATRNYFKDFRQATRDSNFMNLYHYDTFDFIVVGSGSSGAIVANRLSKQSRVLLLEAGGDPFPMSSVPLSAFALATQPYGTWHYTTTPQKNACFLMKNHTTNLVRGKGLGGSSVLNGMIYLRGSPFDYDNWANITQDPIWSYKNLLPFFKKIEDYDGPTKNSKYRGTGGPTHIERARYSPGADNFIKAGLEHGFRLHDANGLQSNGFSYLDANTRHGVRETTYGSYLKPILRNANLQISRYSFAIKIHLDRRRHAYGLTYIRHGVRKFVRATKEIIISAGAIESPKLLMLSGIGPKQHLHSVGLKCRVNLPVGQNLQDHIFTYIGPLLTVPEDSFRFDRDLNAEAILKYYRNGTGPLASTYGNAAVAFMASSKSRNQEWPDIFLLSNYLSLNSFAVQTLIDNLNIRVEPFRAFMSSFFGQDVNFVLLTLGRPKSTGELQLKSKNPSDPPIINPKYLSHPDDIAALVEGAKFAVKLYENSTIYKKIGARFVNLPFSSCEGYAFGGNDYWECYIRHLTLPQYHTAGTCRMGPRKNNSDTVVDSKLRVLKTSGLRVIDLSVAPNVTNANTHSPAMLLGEIGSYLIREHWAQQFQVCVPIEGLITSKLDTQCHYSRHV